MSKKEKSKVTKEKEVGNEEMAKQLEGNFWGGKKGKGQKEFGEILQVYSREWRELTQSMLP